MLLDGATWMSPRSSSPLRCEGTPSTRTIPPGGPRSTSPAWTGKQLLYVMCPSRSVSPPSDISPSVPRWPCRLPRTSGPAEGDNVAGGWVRREASATHPAELQHVTRLGVAQQHARSVAADRLGSPVHGQRRFPFLYRHGPLPGGDRGRVTDVDDRALRVDGHPSAGQGEGECIFAHHQQTSEHLRLHAPRRVRSTGL